MSLGEDGALTDLLRRWHAGEDEARDRLIPIVHQELRRLAHLELRREYDRDVLLQTTVLVNEAYVRLADLAVDWEGRLHFFALCGRLMRRILMDFARQRRAVKRGGGQELLTASDVAAEEHALIEALALDTALSDLAAFDARKYRIVELRCLAGLTIRESAELLDLSHATIERELRVARAWLSRAMGQPESAYARG